MLGTEPDHFVIAAANLEQGINCLESKLDITMPPGGSHSKMGTHNHLMNLGETFLEVIAIDPNASATRKPRWFNLDNPNQQRVLSQSPRLLTWVARTDDIENAVNKTSIPLGLIETVSRGNFTWKITVPEDGSLPEQGLFPTLIQWPENIKPWNNMKNLGYHFHKLELFHPHPSLISEELKKVGLKSEKIEITKKDKIDLKLHLETSDGKIKTL